MSKEIYTRAIYGDIGILNDYTEEQLEEELDAHGWNAYHVLAQGRKKEILKFKGAYKLRNKSGETAIEILLKNFEVDREVLEKFFPWYTPSTTEETIEESLDKIKITSNAEKFILTF